jgi:ABC-2 type transport system permease protein
MKLSRIRAIARKEFLHVARDSRSLALAFGIPVLQLILFGYALTLDVNNVPIVVIDRSGTVISRDFVSRFTGSPYFKLKGSVNDYAALEREIDAGRAMAGLVIPSDFGRKVAAGREAEAQMIFDGSDSNTATIAMNYADSIVLGYSQEITVRAMRLAGGSAMQAPLDIRPRVWYNTDMQSKNFIIPGLIAVIMMTIAALLTSLTVAREWECGTMEQLISTPVRGAELVLGKLIPYFIIGMTDMLIVVLMAEFHFGVHLKGSVGLMFGMAAVFLVGTLSLGILISIVAKNQLLASQMAMVMTYVPSMLMSGFVFAIANMPKTLQMISYLVPARYFVALLRGIYLKGVGLDVLKGEAAMLVAFSVLMLSLAIIKFKKKLV